MRLDLLKEATKSGRDGNWLISIVAGTTPLDTKPHTRQEAMALAQAFVTVHGGTAERYTKIFDKIGLKRLYNSRSSNEAEGNYQVMARNRLKKYGIKVPEFYGFVYAKGDYGWTTYAVLEHIDGKEAYNVTNWESHRYKVEQILDKAGALHTDLHGRNALVAGKDEHLVIIDWEYVQSSSSHFQRFSRFARRGVA